MADLGNILTRAVGNGVLAQSEMLTGIPFFQQAQARQERESVRQDQVAANRARLEAGIRTGLIKEDDVVAAGSADDLVKLENFDDIFNGFISTASVARQETKDQASIRRTAELAAIEAGVGGNYADFDSEALLRMAAAEQQKLTERDRQSQRFKDAFAAVSSAVETLRGTENPTEEHVAQVAAQVTAFVSEAQSPRFSHLETDAFVGSLTSTLNATAADVNRNKGVSEAAEAVRRNDWGTLAESRYRKDALKNPDVAVAINRVDANLEAIQRLSALPENVLNLLSSDPDMYAAIEILDGLPDGAQSAMTLLNDDPKMLSRLSEFEVGKMDDKIAEATVRASLPDLVTRQQDIYEASLRSLSPSNPLQGILESAMNYYGMDVVRDAKGNYIAATSPRSIDPVQESLDYLRNPANTDMDKYMLAYTMSNGGVQGAVPSPEQAAIFQKLESTFFGRLTSEEMVDIELATFDDGVAQFAEPLAQALQSGNFLTLQGDRPGKIRSDLRSRGVEAITARPMPAKLDEEIRRLTEQISSTPESAERTLLSQQLKLAEERKEEAVTRSRAVDKLTDTLITLYTHKKNSGDDFVDDLVTEVYDNFGLDAGFDRETVPGLEAFKEALDRADGDPYENRAAVIAFVGGILEHQDPEMADVVESYSDFLESSEAHLKGDFSYPEFRHTSSLKPSHLNWSEVQVPTDNAQRMIDRLQTGGLTLAGVPVRLPEKRAKDTSYTLPVLVLATLQR